MNQINRIVIYCITALSLVVAYSCIDEESTEPQGKDRYLDPPWLGGTSLEVLEDSANFSIFIELMDKADFRTPITDQLFTLFVPNDDAFKAYFQKIGITGVQDLSVDEAEQLFTLHILTNARSAYQLKYEYYWAEEQGPNGEYASLFYRKQTNSTVIPYKEKVRYNPLYKDSDPITIYNDNKLVPLFSKDFFEDFFGAVDGSDYLFLFPESNWGGDLNWYNAMVNKAEVKTASGFIYYIDKVVGPMPSIEEYFLQNEDKYSIYYDMAQRFAVYESERINLDDNSIMYKKSYDPIENFANEFGPNSAAPYIYKDIFSIFVPSNDVLQEYLNNTVLKYYPSLDSVPEVTLIYILQTHISNSLALMSKIENSYFNHYGNKTEISRSDITAAHMCSNGPFYELNKVFEPNVFKCVPGRLFFDGAYSTFLYALDFAGLISTISDTELDVTLFAVNNEDMAAANIRYENIDKIIETRGSDGQWVPMNTNNLIEFLRDHIYVGSLDDLSGEGYIEMLSKNHAHFKDNKIEGGKNQNLNKTANIDEKSEELNGILYTINGAIRNRYEFGELLIDDPDFSEFANLLIETELLNPENVDQVTLDVIPDLRFINESDYWTAFIPTNEAVIQALADGIIPTDTEELKDFLAYHFIRKNTIFDNGIKSGNFDTNSIDTITTSDILYNKLDISNSVNNLSVTDHTGQVVNIDHANANMLVRKGVIHKINAVLKK